MTDCSLGLKTVLLVHTTLLLPCTQQNIFEYVDMGNTEAIHHTELIQLWACKEKLTSHGEEMKADARDINEESSNMFGFKLIVVDILILLIHLIQRNRLGVKSFMRNLLLCGSVISYCIGLVNITKENSLTQLTAFIKETANCYSIISIDHLLNDIKAFVGFVCIIGCTLVLSAIFMHSYPIEVQSVVWFYLTIAWIGFSVKNWIKLDERKFAKLKASIEITEMFSVDNEQIDAIDPFTNEYNSSNSVIRLYFTL